MLSSELRTKYLEFFKSKGHMVCPSDSLTPYDPSLLYTSAGMVQFKPYFTGERIPPSKRLTTSQKCIRTDDIDEVGDAVHHTFFEMLGNFSIGDYFKRDAILWAWEFLTDVLKINPEHLWTSVYLDDDEAADVWINELGFPKERLVRLGEDKNYWPANAPTKGPNGPCGPCNEIFLDVDPDKGYPEDPAWSIAHDSNRFVEIWNLVFQQFDRQEDGSLIPLPTKNIDTGMGLERTVAVLNGAASNYDTDLFMPIIDKIGEITGVKYGMCADYDRSIRVIADHVRSAVFAIADGVMPSNGGAGYVLRRLTRNAVLKGRKLGCKTNFMVSLIPVVIEIMGDIYPELIQRSAYIEKVIASEENKFRHTLESGMQRLEDMLSSGEKTLAGDVAFILYDTYGFPLELTKEIAAESGVDIDVDGFNAAMEKQREMSKASSDFAANLFGGGGSVISQLEADLQATEFTGYTENCTDTRVVAIIKDGDLVKEISAPCECEIVLEKTPFYAEHGGQVGDTGTISSDSFTFDVSDTSTISRFFFHKGTLKNGKIVLACDAKAAINKKRRMAIARNHSATHLLHAALHEVIGEHALQAGSVVDENRLRFDFSHFQALTSDEMKKIEDKVNMLILDDLCVNTVVTNIEEARKMGATALFGEKYGESVRVVKMGDKSLEFCGGTHLTHTSQIGLFKLISESSVGAGLRRIEAVTGSGAVSFVNDLQSTLSDIATALNSPVGEVVATAARLCDRLKETQKELDAVKAKGASAEADGLIEKAQSFGDVKFVSASMNVSDISALQSLADTVSDKLLCGVVVLAGCSGGKIVFICKVTPQLTKRGFHAGNIIREVAKVTGGGGGGKPEFAQAGSKDSSKVGDALEKAREIVKAAAENK